MAKDPDDRPGSATEFMQDAGRALPETAAAAVPPPPPAAQPGQGGVDDPRRRGGETARTAVVDARRGHTRARDSRRRAARHPGRAAPPLVFGDRRGAQAGAKAAAVND